jgi:hypothetical protein
VFLFPDYLKVEQSVLILDLEKHKISPLMVAKVVKSIVKFKMYGQNLYVSVPINVSCKHKIGDNLFTQPAIETG